MTKIALVGYTSTGIVDAVATASGLTPESDVRAFADIRTAAAFVVTKVDGTLTGNGSSVYIPASHPDVPLTGSLERIGVVKHLTVEFEDGRSAADVQHWLDTGEWPVQVSAPETGGATDADLADLFGDVGIAVVEPQAAEPVPVAEPVAPVAPVQSAPQADYATPDQGGYAVPETPVYAPAPGAPVSVPRGRHSVQSPASAPTPEAEYAVPGAEYALPGQPLTPAPEAPRPTLAQGLSYTPEPDEVANSASNDADIPLPGQYDLSAPAAPVAAQGDPAAQYAVPATPASAQPAWGAPAADEYALPPVAAPGDEYAAPTNQHPAPTPTVQPDVPAPGYPDHALDAAPERELPTYDAPPAYTAPQEPVAAPQTVDQAGYALPPVAPAQGQYAAPQEPVYPPSQYATGQQPAVPAPAPAQPAYDAPAAPAPAAPAQQGFFAAPGVPAQPEYAAPAADQQPWQPQSQLDDGYAPQTEVSNGYTRDAGSGYAPQSDLGGYAPGAAQPDLGGAPAFPGAGGYTPAPGYEQQAPAQEPQPGFAQYLQEPQQQYDPTVYQVPDTAQPQQQQIGVPAPDQYSPEAVVSIYDVEQASPDLVKDSIIRKPERPVTYEEQLPAPAVAQQTRFAEELNQFQGQAAFVDDTKKGHGRVFYVTGSHGGAGKTTCGYMLSNVVSRSLSASNNPDDQKQEVWLIEADYRNSKLAHRLNANSDNNAGYFAAFLKDLEETQRTGIKDLDKIKARIIEDCVITMNSGLKVVTCPYDTTGRDTRFIQMALQQIVDYARKRGAFVFVDADTLSNDDPLDRALTRMADKVILVSDAGHIGDIQRAANTLTASRAQNGMGVSIDKISVFLNKTGQETYNQVVNEGTLNPLAVQGYIPVIPAWNTAWVGDMESGESFVNAVARFAIFMTEVFPIDALSRWRVSHSKSATASKGGSSWLSKFLKRKPKTPKAPKKAKQDA